MSWLDRKDLVRDSADRERQLIASAGLLVVIRPTDGKPLAFGRDQETMARLARRISLVGGWRAEVVRGLSKRRSSTGAAMLEPGEASR